MRRPEAAALLMLILPLAAMKGETPKPEATRDEASRALVQLFADSDEGDLRLVPLAALGRGDLRYASQFGDTITDEWYAAAHAKARAELRRLHGIERGALSAKERIAYDVFRQQAEQIVRGDEEGIARIAQQMPIDHVFGQHISFPQFSTTG
jgi:uncharacterized protein (DUF885 family)